MRRRSARRAEREASKRANAIAWAYVLGGPGAAEWAARRLADHHIPESAALDCVVGGCRWGDASSGQCECNNVSPTKEADCG